MYPIGLRQSVISLRKKGATYGEIRKNLNIHIPKSTISVWCKDIPLSQSESLYLKARAESNVRKGLLIAWAINRSRRRKYLRSIEERVSHLPNYIRKNKDIAKIVLAMLYLGEGGKSQKGSLMFGNSDPKVISLFLYLLRHSYSINEEKFRCTLQCRADQDVKKLEQFWLRITKIPARRFYEARVDPRSVGRPSRKKDYKGVCRIEYFSADLYYELMKAGEVISQLGP